jgi:hypothetical protein
MNLRLWLAILLAFLRPAVEGEGEGNQNPDPNADADADADPDPGSDADPDPDPDADPEPTPEEKLAAAQEETRKERERAEKFEREAAELRVRHAPPPPTDIEAQENARLADPKTTDIEKWQIQANRTLRANTSASQLALAQAQDVSDKTTFSTVMLSDPVAKRYEARVEEELAKVRQKGGNAAREAIYTYLLGKDMREGKFKKKASTTDPNKGVPRGKTPGARSDVPAKGTQTERDKRRARLENVQI